MNPSPNAQRGQARTKQPERHQVEMQLLSLDQWLDREHRVRIVWQYVESLDLSELYSEIKAVDGHVGRDAIDPRILFALWLFATLEGVSSARRLADLTTRDIPYMWLCGGVSVNYHRLADFRVKHGALLERILKDSIAVLLHQNLITLESVAQDGMRVRANAGTSSFRREPSLQDALRRAEEHVEQVLQEFEQDPSGDNRRAQAAKKRAAEEKRERLERATKELEELRKHREERAKRADASTEETRISTTDPEARRMKMGDGGTRPALNVQFVSDCGCRMIVDMDVTNQGTDSGLMAPMHEQLVQEYGITPEIYLVDGGYTKKQDVTELERAGTKVHAPVFRQKRQLAEGKDPYAPKAGDTPEMKAFRQRMGTDEAKEIFRQRPSVAEFPNADCRNRGLTQFRVRGIVKAKAQTLWHVLSYNFTRMLNLNFLQVVMAR